MPGMLNSIPKIVGTKQTTKALQNGQAHKVYLAKDADSHVTEPIRDLCRKHGVPVVEVETMAELGRACAITVGAAVAATIK